MSSSLTFPSISLAASAAAVPGRLAGDHAGSDGTERLPCAALRRDTATDGQEVGMEHSAERSKRDGIDRPGTVPIPTQADRVVEPATGVLIRHADLRDEAAGHSVTGDRRRCDRLGILIRRAGSQLGQAFAHKVAALHDVRADLLRVVAAEERALRILRSACGVVGAGQLVKRQLSRRQRVEPSGEYVGRQ